MTCLSSIVTCLSSFVTCLSSFVTAPCSHSLHAVFVIRACRNEQDEELGSGTCWRCTSCCPVANVGNVGHHGNSVLIPWQQWVGTVATVCWYRRPQGAARLYENSLLRRPRQCSETWSVHMLRGGHGQSSET